MSAKGSRIPIERSTMTFPWGNSTETIFVEGFLATDESDVMEFLGPRMNGYPNNATSRPVNKLELVGYYTNATEATMLGVSGLRGSASIKLGTGETWSGNIILTSSALTGKFNTMTGKVALKAIFYGPVTRTRVPAATT